MGGPTGAAGWAVVGAGAVGPLVAGAKAGCANAGALGGAKNPGAAGGVFIGGIGPGCCCGMGGCGWEEGAGLGDCGGPRRPGPPGETPGACSCRARAPPGVVCGA